MPYTSPAARRELAYPGVLGIGSAGKKVRQLQEWLTFAGHPTAIDADFGPATRRALEAYHVSQGITPSGNLDDSSWQRLVAPMADVLGVTPSSNAPRSAILEVAQAHLRAHPIELGGPNSGPWVRLYMNGNEGPDWLWCAGFVFFVLAQACAHAGVSLPLKATFSCDTLAERAKVAGVFVPGDDLMRGKVSWDALGPVAIFLCRRSPGDWSHTGFALNGREATFESIEGNADRQGSSNGFEVTRRTRGVADKDFVILPI